MANLSDIKRVTEAQYKNNFSTSANQTTLFEIEKQDKLLWKNQEPFLGMSLAPSGTASGTFLGSISSFKYLVILVGATASQNDGVLVFKYLNPYYTDALSAVTTRKRFYLSFVSDVGTLWTRYIDVYSTYFASGSSGYYTSSGTYTSNTSVCLPLEIWGTNNE